MTLNWSESHLQLFWKLLWTNLKLTFSRSRNDLELLQKRFRTWYDRGFDLLWVRRNFIVQYLYLRFIKRPSAKVYSALVQEIVTKIVWDKRRLNVKHTIFNIAYWSVVGVPLEFPILKNDETLRKWWWCIYHLRKSHQGNMFQNDLRCLTM